MFSWRNRLNELYIKSSFDRYSNNELLILSTRKQILTLCFYSENYDIYDHSAKICSTEEVKYILLYKGVQSQTRSDGSSKSLISTINNSNWSSPPPFTSPFTIAIGVTGHKSHSVIYYYHDVRSMSLYTLKEVNICLHLSCNAIIKSRNKDIGNNTIR